jgi:D-ribose pyranose/furanose isomerase RbsD
MLQKGILNPDVLHLLARIRHTNTLVIADWAFPYWDEVETVDITLCRGIPTISGLLDLLHDNRAIVSRCITENLLDRHMSRCFNDVSRRIPDSEILRDVVISGLCKYVMMIRSWSMIISPIVLMPSPEISPVGGAGNRLRPLFYHGR